MNTLLQQPGPLRLPEALVDDVKKAVVALMLKITENQAIIIAGLRSQGRILSAEVLQQIADLYIITQGDSIEEYITVPEDQLVVFSSNGDALVECVVKTTETRLNDVGFQETYLSAIVASDANGKYAIVGFAFFSQKDVRVIAERILFDQLS